MRPATEPRLSRLPKSFPVGAVYVVEGKGGAQGRLDVSARYVVLPGGKRIDVARKRRQSPAVIPVRQRLRLISSDRPQTRRKESLRSSKKFLVLPGTSRQEAR
jgi:hypothetical protein